MRLIESRVVADEREVITVVLAQVRCHVCRAVLPLSRAGAGGSVPLCRRGHCREELGRRRVVAVVFAQAAPVAWLSLRDVAQAAGWSDKAALGVLARLERHGWVEAEKVDAGAGRLPRCWRAARTYRLTERGVPGMRALIDSYGRSAA